jgi:hypothetical protein
MCNIGRRLGNPAAFYGRVLAVAALVGWWVAEPAWAGPKTLAEIPVKTGRLILVEDGPARIFSLEGRTVLDGTVRLVLVTQVRPRDAYDLLVVRDFTGPVHCPVRFRLVVFKPDGPPWVSAEFGNCDSSPYVGVKDDRVTLVFDRFGDQPGETWVYDGRGLTPLPRLDGLGDWSH